MGKPCRLRNWGAFTLVELLVVIGIIAVLIAIILPALNRAQQQSKTVQCMSNMRQVGLALLMYADQNDGYLFPSNMGWSNTNVLPPPGASPPGLTPTGPGNALVLAYPDQWNAYTYNVWTVPVFGVWNPPLMFCPTDLDPLPNAQHTYILNAYMWYYNEKYGRSLPNHLSPSDAILMGEKVSATGDYYMEYGDFPKAVDPTRHGITVGSNYLMLDMHVDTRIITASDSEEAMDPWDFGNGTAPVTQPSQ
jgi:prepilin-type N-terminal cleavage/methylation domain-containing protein